MKGKVHKDVPDVSMLRRELKREQYKFRYAAVLKSTVYTLVVVAAFAVLVATLDAGAANLRQLHDPYLEGGADCGVRQGLPL